MPGQIAIPFQCPSAGVTDPSATLGCGSGPTSNWSEGSGQIRCPDVYLASEEVALERTISGTRGGLRCRPSQRAARLDGGGDLLPLELGARFGLLEQLRVLANLMAFTERVAPSRLEFQRGTGRHVRLPLLCQWLRGNGWARLLQLWAGLAVLESRRGSYRTQTARSARRWFRRRQRLTPVSGWEACGVSYDPNCSQNVDLDDVKEEIVWCCKFFSSWSDIVL